MRKSDYTWSPVRCWCSGTVDTSYASQSREGLEIEYVRCCHCGTVRASEAIVEMEHYYRSPHFVRVPAKPTVINRAMLAFSVFLSGGLPRRREEEQIDFIQETIQYPQSVYDFGCNDGAFLFEWLKRGLDWKQIRGTDMALPTPIGEAICPFHLIALSHVLEHVREPLALLRELAEQLVPHGYLFVQVPRFLPKRGLDWKAGRINLRPKLQMEIPHVWYWTQASFRSLMSRLPLDIVAEHEGGYHLRMLLRGRPGEHRD